MLLMIDANDMLNSNCLNILKVIYYVIAQACHHSGQCNARVLQFVHE